MVAGIQSVNMSIYTKTGDLGTTSLFGGKRILKSSPQIEACGTIDELISYIGFLYIKFKDKKELVLLTIIQKDLQQIMASLAGAKTDLNHLKANIKKFEQYIDKISLRLPKINGFILINKPFCAVLPNVLRTICRRSERRVINYFETINKDDINRQIILKYLNRLSDLFFMMARLHQL